MEDRASLRHHVRGLGSVLRLRAGVGRRLEQHAGCLQSGPLAAVITHRDYGLSLADIAG